MIRAIMAADQENGIGKNGTIPWKSSADLQWFKYSTLDSVVVMGRKTWDDPMIPKPLPKRFNIVVSNRKIESGPNMIINSDKNLESILSSFTADVWIIGGATLFNQTYHLCEEILISRIPGTYNCDTFVKLPEYFHYDSTETINNIKGEATIERYKNDRVS